MNQGLSCPSCPPWVCLAPGPWGRCCHIVVLTSWLPLPQGVAQSSLQPGKRFEIQRWPARSMEMAKETPEGLSIVKTKPPKGRRMLEGWHCRPSWPAQVRFGEAEKSCELLRSKMLGSVRKTYNVCHAVTAHPTAPATFADEQPFLPIARRWLVHAGTQEVLKGRAVSVWVLSNTSHKAPPAGAYQETPEIPRLGMGVAL